MKKWIVGILLGLLTLTSACTAGTGQSKTGPISLNVFAAASLTESFHDLGNAFEVKNPGIKVAFNFGGSQQLVNQLSQGAPADVFASANQKQMDAAVQAGKADRSMARNFAGNRLVVIVPKDNPAKITGLPDLARSGLRLVLAAKEVPAGQYALEFLDKAAQDPAFGAAYKTAVLKNVVSYEDNVKAVLNKVGLGEADGGIVYESDLSGDSKTRLQQIAIPSSLNVSAVYPIAVLKDSKQAAAAQAFVNFVLSEEGQAILTKYGFTPVR